MRASLLQPTGLRAEDGDPGFKPGIRLLFSLVESTKNQNDALAGELMIKIFDKDQNGVIYVNDLYYLEEAFPSESGCACPWVLAIWPQNDYQAGLDASLFIHNAVRQTRTSLWITNVARWLAQGPPLCYTNQHGHMMGNNEYFTWICKTKHKASKRFYQTPFRGKYTPFCHYRINLNERWRWHTALLTASIHFLISLFSPYLLQECWNVRCILFLPWEISTSLDNWTFSARTCHLKFFYSCFKTLFGFLCQTAWKIFFSRPQVAKGSTSANKDEGFCICR